MTDAIRNWSLSASNKGNFFAAVDKLDLSLGYKVDVYVPNKSRSDVQNSLSHAWYQELANNIKEDDALGYKCFCKLHFGVPILRAEDDDFRTTYDSAIKQLSYEQKLKIMKILPVTSLMTTKQLSKYLDEMKSHFEQAKGYILNFPNGYDN